MCPTLPRCPIAIAVALELDAEARPRTRLLVPEMRPFDSPDYPSREATTFECAHCGTAQFSALKLGHADPEIRTRAVCIGQHRNSGAVGTFGYPSALAANV